MGGLPHEKPQYKRSENGPEFMAEVFQEWLVHVRVEIRPIFLGSPCKNGKKPRSKGTLTRRIPNMEWFMATKQAQTSINTVLKTTVTSDQIKT